jgi:hypothetical protein
MMNSRLHIYISLIFILASLFACSPPSQSTSSSNAIQSKQGNLAKHEGTATVWRSYEPEPDDPDTTNDESNDQPVGHFGTVTLSVIGPPGNHYTLDADVDDNKIERLYFPKGGWIDFDDCDLDEDLNGECTDENGNSWTFGGEG